MPNNKPIDVAQNILREAQEKGCKVSNLKLQKLLYFAQCQSYKVLGMPIIDSEFEAWQHGPVIPEVYLKYYSNGASVIPVENNITRLSIEDMEIINDVLDMYGHKNPWELVDITHSQAPWRNAYYGYGNRSTIKNESIREYIENNG